MRRPLLHAAPLAFALCLVAVATNPGCGEESGTDPVLLTPCPNEYPVAGGSCPEAGKVCSYLDQTGCVSYFHATCSADLHWQVETPSACGGSGGAHATGGHGPGGSGAGGGGNAGGGGSAAGGSGAGGGLVCDDEGNANCNDPLPCMCVGCENDGSCGANEDCVCPDCTDVCGCIDDGVCRPFYESCTCADCAGHPLCP